MERITKDQLGKALQVNESMTQGSHLQKRLSPEVTTRLMTLFEALICRYPGQDLTDAIPQYMEDYEALTLKYSIEKVEQAIAALRIDPYQKFFPRPDEVADEIERQRRNNLPSHLYARG